MKAKIYSIFFLLLACVIPIAIFILPILGHKNAVYKLDAYSPFWIFSLQFGVGFLLFAKLSKNFYQWLKNLVSNYKSIIPIFLIVAFAIATSIAFIEPRSRVQLDEAIHYSIAQNFYYNQIGQLCYEGSFMENAFACVLGETIKTRGLSYIYMLGMPFFGKNLYWVHTLHLFFLALALLSFYLALLAWIGKQSLSLLATSLLAACPLLLFCFRSASVEPIYVTLFCVSLLLLKWAYDKNTTRHWLLLALTLAFFAQTRTETVFCLFAFIWVAFYRMRDSRRFALFLATLSFFSIPVLCTLSFNRGHDLQGGSLGAYGHLFSNIASNFKVMALPSIGVDGILKYPFLPYFTWFAILGLITLIILTIKELRKRHLNSPQTPNPIPQTQEIKYAPVFLFLLLLSPQYIILFNGVSADLTMAVQWRFALVILPAMAFLGALFLFNIGAAIQLYWRIKSKLRPQIVLCGALVIILATVLVQYRTFIKDIPNLGNYSTIEDYELHKWIRQEPPKRMLFFFWNIIIGLAHGHSAYSYQTLLNLNSDDLKEILDDYNGEVYFVSASNCDILVGAAKMQSPNTFRMCDRTLRYFNTQEVFSKKTIEWLKPFSIYKILGFNDIDSLGLLRIVNKVEPTDSTVELFFKVPKERSDPWKIQHFINDSLILESPYEKRYYTSTYNFSLFNRDSNVWKLSIVDTITNEHVHSDSWELVKVKTDDKRN